MHRTLHASYIDPNALLTRKQTADALTDVGFPVAEATLATKASRGGGPPFKTFGSRALYRWSAALGWAKRRLASPDQPNDGSAV